MKLNAKTGLIINALPPISDHKNSIPALINTAREGVMTALAGQLDPRLGQPEGKVDYPPNYEAYSRRPDHLKRMTSLRHMKSMRRSCMMRLTL